MDEYPSYVKNIPSNLWYNTSLGNKIVDHSVVVAALHVGAAPTASSLST